MPCEVGGAIDDHQIFVNLHIVRGDRFVRGRGSLLRNGAACAESSAERDRSQTRGFDKLTAPHIRFVGGGLLVSCRSFLRLFIEKIFLGHQFSVSFLQVFFQPSCVLSRRFQCQLWVVKSSGKARGAQHCPAPASI